MPSNFDTRLIRLEKYAPVVSDTGGISPLPKLQVFVEENGGRENGESWSSATARLLGISSAELLTYLSVRSQGQC